MSAQVHGAGVCGAERLISSQRPRRLDPLPCISAVFSKLSRSCSQSSQRSWNEFSSGPSYLWDSPATDPSPSWPASSSSPTHTATVSAQAKPHPSPSLPVLLSRHTAETPSEGCVVGDAALSPVLSAAQSALQSLRVRTLRKMRGCGSGPGFLLAGPCLVSYMAWPWPSHLKGTPHSSHGMPGAAWLCF